MAIASFNPTGSAFLNAGTVSSNVTIPTTGAPTIAMVTNLGSWPAFVAIGTDATLTAVADLGLPVMPGAQVPVTIGANTTLAAVTLAQTTGLNVTVGT
jgi:hypothetical protein